MFGFGYLSSGHCTYVSKDVRISVIRALYLRQQGCEDPWFFFEAKKGVLEQKYYGNAFVSNNGI